MSIKLSDRTANIIGAVILSAIGAFALGLLIHFVPLEMKRERDLPPEIACIAPPAVSASASGASPTTVCDQPSPGARAAYSVARTGAYVTLRVVLDAL